MEHWSKYYKSIVAVVMKPSSSTSSAPHGLIVALRGSHDQPIERKSSFHISTCRKLLRDLQRSLAILRSRTYFLFCRGHSLRDTQRTNEQRTQHDPSRTAQTEGHTQLFGITHKLHTVQLHWPRDYIQEDPWRSLKDVELVTILSGWQQFGCFPAILFKFRARLKLKTISHCYSSRLPHYDIQ